MPSMRRFVVVALVVVAQVGVSVVASACEEPQLKRGVTAKQHEPYFPIKSGVHALGASMQSGQPITCDACHAGANSFAEPRCVVCHVLDERPLTSVHAGIAGFSQADASCFGCHPRGTRGSELGVEDHSNRDFPIDVTDAHGNAAYLARVPQGKDSCEGCHADVEDRAVLLCAECHADDSLPLATAHATLPRSFADNSTACKGCHADTPISGLMHPLENHTFYDPDHHEALCTNCHTAYQLPPKEWALDFGLSNCSGCHNHPPECTPANPGACN